MPERDEAAVVEGFHDDAAAIWTACLESLDSAGSTHKAWLAQVRPVAVSGDTLVLAVPDDFVKEWIEQRYAPTVIAAVGRVVGRPLDIRVTVGPLDDTADEELPRPAAEPRPVADRPQLTPKYTFERFVIGSSNRFAHAAAVAVAEAPAKSYNPLFIYGGAGLGKTHLLHAIGHYTGNLYPQTRIRYVSSEQFTNEFINGIRDDRAGAFQRRYRDNDILLIDDIQFLEGKERTQEEFFHTFNALHNADKQLIISSDRPPKQIATLEDRLRSRFEWGLITDIQPPDLETRIAILRKKSGADGLSVPDDVLSFIASKVQSNIRELEGALIRVTAFSSLNGSPIDLALAEIVLKDLFPDEGRREVSVPIIMAETATYFGLTIEDLTGSNRSRLLVTARQMAMYLTRELTDLSLPKIGQAFGGRDHTTVMHATQKIRGLMRERRSIYNQVQELTNRVRVRAQQQGS
ncbi:MAG TPA: chromosomal replication initiator protein DnaA [Actinomycetota bacterium]|nr:chromosomal replication initiator protein DnaA [Actinomycetota bacterium]